MRSGRCAVNDCPEVVIVARGWCVRHYGRWRNHGDPLGGSPRGLSTDERFFKKVMKRPDGCWEWVASRLPDGYGCFWDGTYRRTTPKYVTRMVRAHRWSYERFVGPIPARREVCHRCDRPWCVNPGHLFLGTHHDNMGDSALKGRQGVNRRQRNGRAKLTEVQVAHIRDNATGRYGEISDLARQYGVGSGTMSKILKGQTWA